MSARRKARRDWIAIIDSETTDYVATRRGDRANTCEMRKRASSDSSMNRYEKLETLAIIPNICKKYVHPQHALKLLAIIGHRRSGIYCTWSETISADLNREGYRRTLSGNEISGCTAEGHRAP